MLGVEWVANVENSPSLSAAKAEFIAALASHMSTSFILFDDIIAFCAATQIFTALQGQLLFVFPAFACQINWVGRQQTSYAEDLLTFRTLSCSSLFIFIFLYFDDSLITELIRAQFLVFLMNQAHKQGKFLALFLGWFWKLTEKRKFPHIKIPFAVFIWTSKKSKIVQVFVHQLLYTIFAKTMLTCKHFKTMFRKLKNTNITNLIVGFNLIERALVRIMCERKINNFFVAVCLGKNFLTEYNYGFKRKLRILFLFIFLLFLVTFLFEFDFGEISGPGSSELINVPLMEAKLGVGGFIG